MVVLKWARIALYVIILTVWVLFLTFGVLKVTCFSPFMLFLTCDRLGSWKRVLKWLCIAPSTALGLRTASIWTSCLPIYVVDSKQVISLLFRYWTWFLHDFYIIPGWDLTWHSLGVLWWSLSELVFQQRRTGGPEMNLLHRASVVVWSVCDSPACHHRSIGALSLILTGHHLLGSHPHLACGGTLTWKCVKARYSLRLRRRLSLPLRLLRFCQATWLEALSGSLFYHLGLCHSI